MWRFKMIFRDEYTGQKREIFNKRKFKEFNLYENVDYTTRSLELIYPMYCQWLNTRHGIYLYEMKLSIDDSVGVCNESLLDCLFHRVQGDIEHRNTGPDKSIDLIWKTYRKGSMTIIEGYFLMPMSEAEKADSPRGDKAEIPKSVHRIFSRILEQYSIHFHEDMFDDDALDLRFQYSTFGEGYEVIFSDSNIEVHEIGFNILCQIAQLPREKQEVESTLFRLRKGYTPAHGYFCTSVFEPLLFSM
jgi:hypothetical protein